MLRRKRAMFSTVFACVVAHVAVPFCVAQGRSVETDPRQEIVKIIHESTQGLNRMDMEAALKHVHPTGYTEYTHLPQKPLAGFPKPMLIEICKAIFPSLKIKIGPPVDLKVKVKGDMAYATYRSTEQLGDNPSFTVRRTEIYVREKGEWLLSHAHRSILSGDK